MRRFITITLSLYTLLVVAMPIQVWATASTPSSSVNYINAEQPAPVKCPIPADPKSPSGVLVSHVPPEGSGLGCYLTYLLTDNMPYVILLAVVLVVLSGVQYMLAMGSSAEQGKAKTRILGILAGVIFYFLLRYLIPLIAGSVKFS